MWMPAAEAPDDVVVMTKIDDEKGCRNEARLKRSGNLWFIPNGEMYVYYQPTHYRRLTADEQQDVVDRLTRSVEAAKQRVADLRF